MAEKRGKKGKKAESVKQESSSLRSFYVVLIAVAVIGVGAVGYSVGSSALSGAVTEPVDLGDISDTALARQAVPMERGNPDAPVTIIEFADYQCPACRQFATQYKPLVDLNYVEPGTAKFVFYDFPLVRIHPNAFFAARAARCAHDQGAFWEYHDALFRNHSDWVSQTNPGGSFVDYAESLGLDEGDFEACLKSDRHADVVTANMRLAERLGVGGTPTIMVSQGRGMAQRLQAFDFQTISQAVESALEQ